MSVTATVSKEYIENIQQQQDPKPVPGGAFVAALEATHGTESVQQAFQALFQMPSDRFNGAEAFKARLTDALCDAPVNGLDQKYLASYVERVAAAMPRAAATTPRA